ncbi:unnamed protein product [Chrysoparadoxa australica]
MMYLQLKGQRNRLLLWLSLLLLQQQLIPLGSSFTLQCSIKQDSRRDFISHTAQVAGLAALSGASRSAVAVQPQQQAQSPRPFVYRVDYTDPPVMVPYPTSLEGRAAKELAAADMVFLGHHRGEDADHQLEADIISRIAGSGRVVVGLEMVEQQFQPALDAYIRKDIGNLEEADARLKRDTEWDERWAWSIEGYLPVLHLARSRGMKLVALSPDTESLDKVLAKGLEALDPEDRERYVADPKAFVDYVKDPGFNVYANKVITPGFTAEAEEAGLTRQNYFSARLLWDEAVASKAARTVAESSARGKEQTLVVLQGLEHVKYGFGSSGRAQRLKLMERAEPLSVRTVLLNPTAEDSLSPTTNLRLALAYAEDLYALKPLSNYVWYSTMPKPNQLTRMMDPEDSLLGRFQLYDLKDLTEDTEVTGKQ